MISGLLSGDKVVTMCDPMAVAQGLHFPKCTIEDDTGSIDHDGSPGLQTAGLKGTETAGLLPPAQTTIGAEIPFPIQGYMGVHAVNGDCGHDGLTSVRRKSSAQW